MADLRLFDPALKVEIRDGVEDPNERKEVIKKTYQQIPDHWKRLAGSIRVALFSGPITKRINSDIKKLMMDGANWNHISFNKPRSVFADVVYSSKNRSIYIQASEYYTLTDSVLGKRSFGRKLGKRGDYDIKRDFLDIFAKFIWDFQKGKFLRDFCRKNFVVDWTNFYLPYVPSMEEVRSRHPEMKTGEIQKLRRRLTDKFARDSFGRIWQLFISNPGYLEEKMEGMVPLIKKLDRMISKNVR